MRPKPALLPLLLPLSWCYRGVVRLREAAYRRGLLQSHALPGTVISVGNLTVGGTGKTPMVRLLAEYFSGTGVSTGILIRGYRGDRRDPHVMAAGRTTGQRAGPAASDEVQLLAGWLGNRARLGVGADRVRSAELLAGLGVQCFLLDDGFQHRRIARHADVVLIDGADPFGNGRLLPAGPLREPLSALARADLLVITRTPPDDLLLAQVRRHTAAPLFHARTQFLGLRPVVERSIAQPESSAGKSRALAFCAIGNPAAFFRDLREWGCVVAGQRAFPDDHRFTPGDVAGLETAAEAAAAEILICTEKDLPNLSGVSFARLPLYVAETRLVLAEENKFFHALLDVIERRKAAR